MSDGHKLPAPLSKTGHRMLAKAEATIEAGLGTFLEVGNALQTIRDGRLFRDDYDSFESYCRGRWQFTTRRANQLMDAAQIGTMVPIANERQARELGPIADDPEAVREAWDEASADGKPTAAKIAQAVQRRTTTETTTTNFDPATGEIFEAPSGSDQPASDTAGAAGPGNDEPDSGEAAPSPAPKVAPHPERLNLLAAAVIQGWLPEFVPLSVRHAAALAADAVVAEHFAKATAA